MAVQYKEFVVAVSLIINVPLAGAVALKVFVTLTKDVVQAPYHEDVLKAAVFETISTQVVPPSMLY
jgi:hypothetical protein